MSVVIRGMKMPIKCGLCPCFHAEWPMYCQAVKADKNKRIVAPYGMPRPEWCPLVELPAEHGRLGDLDAMAFDESEAYMSAQAKLGRDVITTGLNSIVHRKIQLLIMDTPTVIEAEEVGDG